MGAAPFRIRKDYGCWRILRRTESGYVLLRDEGGEIAAYTTQAAAIAHVHKNWPYWP